MPFLLTGIVLSGTLTGCSAIASLLPSQEAASATGNTPDTLQASCSTLSTTLAGVNTALTAAEQAITALPTPTSGTTVTSEEAQSFTTAADDAQAVADALQGLSDQLLDTRISTSVSKLETSMEFFADYYRRVAQASADLPSAEDVTASADSASSSAAQLVDLCSPASGSASASQ